MNFLQQSDLSQNKDAKSITPSWNKDAKGIAPSWNFKPKMTPCWQAHRRVVIVLSSPPPGTSLKYSLQRNPKYSSWYMFSMLLQHMSICIDTRIALSLILMINRDSDPFLHEWLNC